MEPWMIIGGLCVSAIIEAIIGKMKGQPIGGLIFGLLLGPLGWLITFLVSDVRPKCPACGGVVVPGFPKCKNCGSALP
jgi:hypothetical protein